MFNRQEYSGASARGSIFVFVRPTPTTPRDCRRVRNDCGTGLGCATGRHRKAHTKTHQPAWKSKKTSNLSCCAPSYEEKCANQTTKIGNAEFSREIRETEKELRALDSANANRDSFLHFCELALVDIPQVWRTASEDQRRRVRTILFPDGILVGADRKISEPAELLTVQCVSGNDGHKNRSFLRLAAPQGFEPR